MRSLPSYVFAVLFFLLCAVAGMTTADVARAETPPVQKALENVRESLDTLIGGKDEATSSDELGLRVSTYRTVLELSAAETKDLVQKLASMGEPLDDPSSAAWKEASLAALEKAAAFYESENAALDATGTPPTLEDVRGRAESFKQWRENDYLPVAGQIRDLSMIEQGAGTLDLAGRRLEKVSEDVEKILKARIRGADALKPLLVAAGEAITEGRKLNEAAAALFKEKNFLALQSTSTGTSTATSSVSADSATSTPDVPETSAEAGIAAASSTPPLPPPPSIRDLVRESLVKTRDAYRIFIEMSNVVRTLLA